MPQSTQELPTFLARLCWNSAHWVRPTGEAKATEKGTYVTDFGFGHEEWLFNLAWVLDDGFHYAYLQPMNDSWKNFTGQTIRVRLFTIAPDRQRFYVGELRSCDVLNEEQAAAASKAYKKRGWADERRKQLVELGAKLKGLDGPPLTLFNIRFRPQDATYFTPHRPALPMPLAKQHVKYKLYNWHSLLTKDFKKSGPTPTPEKKPETGGVKRKPTKTIQKRGTAPSSYDPVHNILQTELYKLLRKEHGKGAVTMEEGKVDLRVRLPNRNILIELKTTPSARLAIRHALGQLLEYAHFAQSSNALEPEFVVVAPAVPDEEEERYLKSLKAKLNVQLSYRTYQRGMKEFKL